MHVVQLEGRLTELHYIVAQSLEQFNRSMDWVLSRWVHLTVLRFIFAYVCFVYAYFVQLWFLSFSLAWHRLNFECRSEMCCTQLAENTGRKNYTKIAICAPSYNFIRLYIFATKACIDNQKKSC